MNVEVGVVVVRELPKNYIEARRSSSKDTLPGSRDYCWANGSKYLNQDTNLSRLQPTEQEEQFRQNQANKMSIEREKDKSKVHKLSLKGRLSSILLRAISNNFPGSSKLVAEFVRLAHPLMPQEY